MINYSKVRRSGKEAGWLKVLRTLNAENNPISAKDLLEKAETGNGDIIRNLHNDNLISRKKIGSHNKMGYMLSYKGLKTLNEAEKELRKKSK